LSSPRPLDEDYSFASPVSNKYQVLRDLRENYPSSDGELSCCEQPLSASVGSEHALEVGSPIHSSYHLSPKELSVYNRRKKSGKEVAEAESVEADCVADSGPEVPIGLVSSTNDFVAK